jgi:hypothetical protein
VSRIKPAEIRLYLDADVLGLAKVLGALRPDVTYPGDPGAVIHKRERPPCPITPEVNDSVWIPRVATWGWLIITRDRHIQAHQAEVDSVRNHGAKMIALSGNEATSTFAQLEILMCQWRNIESLAGRTGPFIYTATRTSLKAIPLD